jgi:hypothetical protein
LCISLPLLWLFRHLRAANGTFNLACRALLLLPRRLSVFVPEPAFF